MKKVNKFLGLLFSIVTLFSVENVFAQEIGVSCTVARRQMMSVIGSQGLVMCDPATMKWTSASGAIMTGGNSNAGLNDSYTEFKVDINGVRVLTATGVGLGIGNASPSYALDMIGKARGQGFMVTSDETLKKNFQPLSPEKALSAIMKINVGTFEWKENSKPDFGYIAQNVEKETASISPIFVDKDSNGIRSVAYEKVAALAVQAMKAQNEKINKLEIENKKLSEEIEKEKTGNTYLAIFMILIAITALINSIGLLKITKK